MLTAMGQEEDIVKGLETGGDDYISKPFSLDIISARIKAVLRRSNIKNDELTKTINIHGVIIRPRSREVIIDNKNINLTFTEFQILFLLASQLPSSQTYDSTTMVLMAFLSSVIPTRQNQ